MMRALALVASLFILSACSTRACNRPVIDDRAELGPTLGEALCQDHGGYSHTTNDYRIASVGEAGVMRLGKEYFVCTDGTAVPSP